MKLKIVLKVSDYERFNLNGKDFDRYKLKILEGTRTYENYGFRIARDEMIQEGDVLEDMEVVGKLTREQVCREFYRAKYGEDVENSQDIKLII